MWDMDCIDNNKYTEVLLILASMIFNNFLFSKLKLHTMCVYNCNQLNLKCAL